MADDAFELVSEPAAETPSAAAAVVEQPATVSVADYEDDLFADAQPAGRSRGKAISGKSLALVAVLLVMASAGYVWRQSIAGLLGGGAPEVAPAGGSVPPASTEVDPPETPPAAPPPPDSEPPIEEIDVSAGVLPDLDVSADPEGDPASPEQESALLPAVPQRSIDTSPATLIEAISWLPDDAGGTVLVELDGYLDEERYTHLPLDYAPTREMVKIRGIAEPYLKNLIRIDSPELQQIRLGFHAGNETHVVFDFAGPGSHVFEIRNLGDRLEVVIRKR